MPVNIKSKMINDEGLASLQTLVPGAKVDLQITMPAASKRVKTDYVGMLLDECLLFHIPTSVRWVMVRDALKVDNEVVVRSVLEGDAGQIIAFRVNVLKLITKPSGLLITSFPKRVESIGLRSTKRAQLGISITLTSDVYPDDDVVSGIIVDISSKGCKIALQIKEDWPVLLDDAPVSLIYAMDGKNVSLNASVKNHKIERDIIYYGIAFDSDEKGVGTLLSRHTLLA